MMHNYLEILLPATLLILTFCGVNSDDCTDIFGNKDSKGWVHIEKLNGLTVKIPDSQFNSTYEIGVCKNLLEGETNQYAGALEYNTQENRTIVVGRYNESELIYGTHWILLKYMNGEPYEGICSNSSRHAAIMFVCNHDVNGLDKVSIIDENLGRDRNCYHLFEVENCIACISDGCSAFFTRFSPGSVIVIVLFSTVTAYLLFGWLYTRCIRKQRGWKQIPNAEFWQEIGHLQADGCDMMCRCGKRPTSEYHVVAGESSDQPQSLMSDDDDILLPP